MKLNPDQQRAVQEIKAWARTPEKEYILSGEGGSGKSFVLKYILKELPNLKVAVLAPTNEALHVVQSFINNEVPGVVYKTIDSALGIRPDDTEEEIEFRRTHQVREDGTEFLEGFDLIVVEEASMVNDYKMELLKAYPNRRLWCGHESQLPAVVKDLKYNDDCTPVVFKMDCSMSRLTIPQRNTGDIYKFNQYRERQIYDRSLPDLDNYKISSSVFNKVFTSKVNQELFLDNKLKVVAWRNKVVDDLNLKVRQGLYGVTKAETEDYLKGDLIIGVEPTIWFDKPIFLSEEHLMSSANGDNIFTTNTKFQILENTPFGWDTKERGLGVLPVTMLKVKPLFLQYPVYMYTMDDLTYEKLKYYWTQKALHTYEKPARGRAFRKMRQMLACFSRFKYYYVATAYRLQGASVEHIVSMDRDMSECYNKELVARLKYVASSRAVKSLMVY